MTATAEIIELAEASARAGAEELLRHYGRGGLVPRRKSDVPTDVVTDADIASEEACRRVIERARPDDEVTGEERPASHGQSALRWFVDPLDSTANFVRELPIWSVSVGCEDVAGPLAGAVADPLRGQVFAGGRSWPPRCGGEPVPGRPRAPTLEAGMMVLGLGPGSGRQGEIAGGLFKAVGKVRSPGSPALGLAWTAVGRYDAAYYEMNFSRWDVSAGIALCHAAGLEVMELSGSADRFPRLLVAPAHLSDRLRALVGMQPR